MSEQIQLQSIVLLNYSIAMTNGTIIESSFEEDQPLQITMGNHELPEGMELALIGLRENEEQTLTLTPEQCFGERNEDNIHFMSASEFPEDMPPEPGLTFSFSTEDGEDIPGTVRATKDDQVEVDFNHPLAGHALIFRVEILGINNVHAHIQDL